MEQKIKSLKGELDHSLGNDLFERIHAHDTSSPLSDTDASWIQVMTKILKIIENPWRIARTSNEFGIWYWNSIMPWNSRSCCCLYLSAEKQPRKWIAPRMKMFAGLRSQ